MVSEVIHLPVVWIFMRLWINDLVKTHKTSTLITIQPLAFHFITLFNLHPIQAALEEYMQKHSSML